MARPPRKSPSRKRLVEESADGFWDRPVLINMVADLLIVLAFAGLAWAAATAIQRLPIFPLREVVVVGKIDNVTRNQVEQAARVALTGNFFTVDLDSVREAFERLPWVRQAAVRRHWPDTVELVLEEHVAVARWHRPDGESRLVNDYGEVFAAASDQRLPVFIGPEGSAPQMLARYGEFGQALAKVERSPASVALSNRESWQVELDDGVLLKLGRDEAQHPLSERMARFITYYRPALEQTRLGRAGVVDMRYPNGFALRPSSSEQKS